MLVEGSLAFEHICVGGAPYLEVHWNTHQALWILTKWQLQMLQNKCNFLHEYGGYSIAPFPLFFQGNSVK